MHLVQAPNRSQSIDLTANSNQLKKNAILNNYPAEFKTAPINDRPRWVGAWSSISSGRAEKKSSSTSISSSAFFSSSSSSLVPSSQRRQSLSLSSTIPDSPRSLTDKTERPKGSGSSFLPPHRTPTINHAKGSPDRNLKNVRSRSDSSASLSYANLPSRSTKDSTGKPRDSNVINQNQDSDSSIGKRGLHPLKKTQGVNNSNTHSISCRLMVNEGTSQETKLNSNNDNNNNNELESSGSSLDRSPLLIRRYLVKENTTGPFNAAAAAFSTTSTVDGNHSTPRSHLNAPISSVTHFNAIAITTEMQELSRAGSPCCSDRDGMSSLSTLNEETLYSESIVDTISYQKDKYCSSPLTPSQEACSKIMKQSGTRYSFKRLIKAMTSNSRKSGAGAEDKSKAISSIESFPTHDLSNSKIQYFRDLFRIPTSSNHPQKDQIIKSKV
ncbi:hypothetical protein BGZ76_010073 [Entomortierella beljakovae]|nr:hypothetical protein BGZ76_010073 [Entomortierella beljakovae]